MSIKLFDKFKNYNMGIFALSSNRIVSVFANILICAVLFLSLFQLPEFVVFNGHDEGSQAAIEYWTLHGFSYGKDIIQNVGPFGFLNYPNIYTGFLGFHKLIIILLLTIFLIFLLLKNSKSLPVPMRIIFLLLVVFFVVGDPVFYLLFLMTAYFLISSVRIKEIFLATLVLSLLSLTKGTCFFIALFIIFAAIITNIFSRRLILAVYILTAFVIFTLGFWLLVGQSIFNLPEFVRGSMLFSNGYNDAMTLFETKKVRLHGFVVLFLSLLPILWKTLVSLRNIRVDLPEMVRRLSLCAVDLFILFIAWKHGFVRADDHVWYFFQYALVSCPWVLFRENLSYNLKNRFSRYAVLILSIFICSAIITLSLLSIRFKVMFAGKCRKIDRTMSGIFNLPNYFKKLNLDLQKNIEKMKLPNIRLLVGKDTISYFGILPASAIYNDFNYLSTPSTISFGSWNEWIMDKDAFFFSDINKAPEYLLYNLTTIDNRLPAQDSSLAQLELLHHYEVVGAEKGNILLHRIKRGQPITRDPILKQEYEVEEWVDVPQDTANPVWVKIRIYENFLEHMVAFFYKPPQYSIEMLFKNGDKKVFKLIPKMAAIGFMLNPLLVDNSSAAAVRFEQEYQRYLNDSSVLLSRVVAFKIHCNKLRAFGGHRFMVVFDEIRGLHLGYDKDISKLYKLNAQQFDFDIELMDFKVPFPIEGKYAFGENYFQFHAPSQIKIFKPAGVQELKAFYAMCPGAYESGGATDGVLISISLETVQQKSIQVFSKDFDPVRIPGDRGEQLLDVKLPEESGIISIEISPKGNASWDQFIIRKLRIENLSD